MTRPRARAALGHWRALLGYAAGIAAGVVAWQLIGLHSANFVFVPLTATLSSLGSLISNGSLPSALASSFSVYAIGVALAIVVGAVIGMLFARRALLRKAFEPYLVALYATPMVALIPFILSLMGFGFAPKVLVVFLFSVFPVLYNTVEGARSIKPELIEVARSFRSSEWALWREVMVPYTLPFAMTGVRQAIGRGLVGMVAAEFFLSSTGLGQLIMTASQNFDTGGVFAAILVIGLIGVALTRLGQHIENRYARWRY
jgi:NitT/TauT family transport system permease protein